MEDGRGSGKQADDIFLRCVQALWFPPIFYSRVLMARLFVDVFFEIGDAGQGMERRSGGTSVPVGGCSRMAECPAAHRQFFLISDSCIILVHYPHRRSRRATDYSRS